MLFPALLTLAACGLAGPDRGRTSTVDTDVRARPDRVLDSAVATFRYYQIPVRESSDRLVDSGNFAVRGLWGSDLVADRIECDRETAQSQLPHSGVDIRVRLLAVPREMLPDPDLRDPAREPRPLGVTRIRLTSEAYLRGTDSAARTDRCRLTGAFEQELLGSIIAGAG